MEIWNKMIWEPSLKAEAITWRWNQQKWKQSSIESIFYSLYRKADISLMQLYTVLKKTDKSKEDLEMYLSGKQKRKRNVGGHFTEMSIKSTNRLHVYFLSLFVSKGIDVG